MNVKKYILSNSDFIASENFDDRCKDTIVDTIIIHCISLPEGAYGNDNVVSFFTNELDINCHSSFKELDGVRVSSHLLIKRDGKTIQFVPFDKRAWHAGESYYNGRSNFNEFSIGIELEGTVNEEFTDMQYKELLRIIKYLKELYPSIKDDNILGHRDIAPDRKNDPGASFRWDKIK